MPTGIKIFVVKDGPDADANVLFKGPAKNVCEYLNIASTTSVYKKCDTGSPLYGDYYIYSAGKGLKNLYTNTIVDKPKPKPEPRPVGRPAKKVSKKRENYLRILHCLDIYGNTSSSRDPKIYAEDFKRDGYEVDIRYRPKIVIKGIGFAESEIWDEIWIITLIKKVEVN